MQIRRLFVAHVLTLVSSILMMEFDNSVRQYPSISCEDNSVVFSFETVKPFLGRVFIKGMPEDGRCSRNFAMNLQQTNFSVVIQQGDCNMMKQRTRSPSEGVLFSVVVIVSFHGTFITKVDRAYRLLCFFKVLHSLTNVLDVSTLGTTELYNTVRLPTCTYSVRESSPTGSIIRYAKVGDRLFHVWECDDDKFGILVHNCNVDDSRGNTFQLLDADGCSVDPVILSELQYDEPLTRAVAETNGFKFTDTSSMQFFCSIEMCRKSHDECAGVAPPKCKRSKRQIGTDPLNKTNEFGFDLMYSLDVLDNLEPDTVSPLDTFLNNNKQRVEVAGKTCLSNIAFGLLVSLLIILIITSFATSCLVLLSKSTVDKAQE